MLEDKNSKLVEDFKKKQEFHKEKIESILQQIEASRKYQQIEKEKYKRKIKALKEELPKIETMKFGECSEDETEETEEEEESEVVTKDEEKPEEEKASVERKG